MRCQRDLRELKKADALTLISQMETRPQHLRLVAGTRPATTLSPVAYISTDFIGCAEFFLCYSSRLLDFLLAKVRLQHDKKWHESLPVSPNMIKFVV